MQTDNLSFPHYLAAKRSIDDRALNLHVWRALQDRLAETAKPLRVLEIGAGTGTMFQRMVEWGALRQGTYTAIDASAENTASGLALLPAWAGQRRLACSKAGNMLHLSGQDCDLTVTLETADLYDYVPRQPEGQAWDLIVAHAFLDLVDVPAILPQLLRILCPRGLLYLTLNFDGLTILEPPVDPRLDEKIITLYHQSMDSRTVAGKPSGDSLTGRRLFGWLRQAGLDILEAGSSDWVVFAHQGRYLEGEAHFLQFILSFFEQSLSNHPELAGGPFQEWLAARRAQVERGELVYIAHQMDFLVAYPG
jgi:SAM-dependent methyltransferase